MSEAYTRKKIDGEWFVPEPEYKKLDAELDEANLIAKMRVEQCVSETARVDQYKRENAQLQKELAQANDQLKIVKELYGLEEIEAAKAENSKLTGFLKAQHEITQKMQSDIDKKRIEIVSLRNIAESYKTKLANLFEAFKYVYRGQILPMKYIEAHDEARATLSEGEK